MTPDEARILSAQRRTRAMCVLLAIRAAREILEDALHDNAPSTTHLAKIRRWETACMEQLGVGRGQPSAGMQRECDRVCDALNAIRQRHTGGKGCHDPFTWAAWVCCVDTLLGDVRVVCGVSGACWRFLAQTWDTWMRAMLRAVEDERDSKGREAAELAWDIYMDAQTSI